MKTRAKASAAVKSSIPFNPDNPNRLKPGALFWITIEGRRQALRYPTRRGKLPVSKIREIIDGVVALRKQPIFKK